MIRTMLCAAALVVPGLAAAKLPPPPQDPAALAKAAEAKAKSAWASKVAAYKLCLVQDRLAARFGDKAGNRGAAVPVSTTVPATPSNAGNPVTGAQGGGTPVVAEAPKLANCTDPGPFTYTPPGQKPLEAAGAHSPAATAVRPPTTGVPEAAMDPAGKPGASGAQKP